MNKQNQYYMNIIFIVLLILATVFLFALEITDTGHGSGGGGHGADYALTFFHIVIILVAAKLSGLVEKWGQPAVLGELVIGVILGNLGLLGVHFFDAIGHNNIILFLAELGVVILLFEIGLESHIKEMTSVGFRAFLVAIIGVVAPFLLGTFVVGPWLLPGLEFNTYLFLGATLTATSVGITARVFKDLGKLHIPEAKIVLGAAVIDDILGLVILAVVSALVTAGHVGVGTVFFILMKAILFLVAAIFLGQLIAPSLGSLLSRVNPGTGMKFTLALSFGLLFAYLASLIGLAPIVGAFAAGLILDPVHFRHFKNPSLVNNIKASIQDAAPHVRKAVNKIIRKHAEKHVEHIIEPISLFLVPIFFVVTGFAVDLQTLFNLKTLAIALTLTVMAIIGKIVAGLAAGKVNKWIVGWGMVPRGEVGLIFATIGKGLGVVNDSVFSVIVIMVILTTLITPPILNYILKRQTADSQQS